MKTLKMLGAAAALVMMAAQPVLAATPASKLSLTNAAKADVRASGKAGSSKQFLGGEGWILPVVIVVAVGLGLYFALEGDDSGSP